MKRFLEALGYTYDSDDDSNEFNERPNENLPDASSAHRQASPEDIDQQPQPHSKPTLLPQSIQEANSHQCEVHKLQLVGSEEVSEEVANLAVGTRDTTVRFSGYIINGVRYHMKARELKRKTQNNGVMLKAMTSSYSSARDMNPQQGDVTYYGRITDMVELYYTHNKKYVLFNCDWIDNNQGLVLIDEFGFTLVNFSRLLYTKEHSSNEPFILASQAQQVFYVQDPSKEDWSIIIKMKPRDLFKLCEVGDSHIADIEVDGIYRQLQDDTTRLPDENNMWIRDDLSGLTLDDDVDT